MAVQGRSADVAPLARVLGFSLGLALLLVAVLFPIFPDRVAGESDLESRELASAVLVAVIASSLLALYLYATRPKEALATRRLVMLALLVAAWTAGARLLLGAVLPDEDRQFLPYLLPVAAAPMIVAALLEAPLALAVAALLALLSAYAGYSAPDVRHSLLTDPLEPLQMSTVYLAGSLAGIYLVHRTERLSRYLAAGAAVTTVSFASLMAFWLLDSDRQMVDIPWMALSTAVGGFLVAMLAVGGFIILAMVFGITTRTQLMELAQLHHRLLRRLQEEAPGTFHHSLIVSNLAERAAEAVGADALLARVGAYYHDVGKLAQPSFYIENLTEDPNPHEGLEPDVSAQRIVEHVRFGLALARSQGLPPVVTQFIPQHHGTRLVTYFYRKAAERDASVDGARFAYPGPKPQSRESAIVMLADSSEAVVRSSEDRSPERIDALVEGVIAERMAEGQLDESDITMRDLRAVAAAFKATLRAVYHQRIPYPAPSQAEERQMAAAARFLRTPSTPIDGIVAPATERTEPGRQT